MGIKKPFHRSYREYSEQWNCDFSYIIDEKYAENPYKYIRAFKIILNELKELFEFIEPCDSNLDTYSLRIHQLMIRACIEVEANFKAILRENTFNTEENKWNIRDFKLVNKTHHLDAYKIGIPSWNGSKEKKFEPFSDWKNGETLCWYQAYNKSKHDRAKNFEEANLRNLLGAVTGLLALLTSQFGYEFPPRRPNLAMQGGGNYPEEKFGIGNYFTVEFPDDWTDEEKYDFNWSALAKEEERFQKFNYDEIQKEI